jgi:hypothetical protein
VKVYQKNPKDPRDDTKLQSDNDDDRPSKRQKLQETDMPWFNRSDDSTFTYCDPSCKETCRLLQFYNQDISKAKFFIKITPNSPTRISPSQWEWIFKRDAIDLNQIFTSLHHVIPDEEKMGHLGGTEIMLEFLRAKNELPPHQSGHLPEEEHQRPLVLPFPSKKKNSPNMETTLRANLLPNLPLSIIKSSSTTSLFEMRLPEANIFTHWLP